MTEGMPTFTSGMPNRDLSVAARMSQAPSYGKIEFSKGEEWVALDVLETTWQKGAVGVVNNLKVLSHKSDISDANLQVILSDIISKEFPLAKNVNISVKDGIASISGEVPRLSDKYSIEEDFYPVLGIKGVVDNLTINPQLFF